MLQRFAARVWSCARNASGPSRPRARTSSRVRTLTPSHSSRLSVGGRMCVSVTVLSMRSLRPVSTLPPRAVSTSVRLIRSHTSARTEPIDF